MICLPWIIRIDETWRERQPMTPGWINEHANTLAMRWREVVRMSYIASNVRSASNLVGQGDTRQCLETSETAGRYAWVLWLHSVKALPTICEQYWRRLPSRPWSQTLMAILPSFFEFICGLSWVLYMGLSSLSFCQQGLLPQSLALDPPIKEWNGRLRWLYQKTSAFHPYQLHSNCKWRPARGLLW